MTEDEMVGWHNQLNGHEFEKTPGDNEGQGSLACRSPRDCKESDTAERMNNKERQGFVSPSKTVLELLNVNNRGNLTNNLCQLSHLKE